MKESFEKFCMTLGAAIIAAFVCGFMGWSFWAGVAIWFVIGVIGLASMDYEAEQKKLKKCSHCGEDVQSVAIKCKHCGSAI